jgi:hypothetical protein
VLPINDTAERWIAKFERGRSRDVFATAWRVHVQLLTQFAWRLAILRLQPIQQPSAASICQLGNGVVVNPNNM